MCPRFHPAIPQPQPQLNMVRNIFKFLFLDTSLQANSINSLLSSKLPDPKTELAAASILANMNRINQSPCSDEVESLTSSSGLENHLQVEKTIKLEEDGQQSSNFEADHASDEVAILT